MISQELASLLDLSKNEAKVLGVLDGLAPKNMAETVRQAKLPRMTVYGVIDNLIERNLALKTKQGVRYVYQTNKAELDTLISAYAKKDIAGSFIFESVNMHTLWDEVGSLPAGTRVLGIQPTPSLLEALKRLEWHKHLKELQQKIVAKPIIMEAVVADDYYPAMIKFYSRQSRGLAKKAIGSFVGRASNTVFVPSNMLQVKTELYILPRAVYLLNWQDEIAVKITNSEIMAFMRELFYFAQGYGKKVNVNEYLKTLLKSNLLAAKNSV